MSKEKDELVDKIQRLLTRKYGDSSMASMRKLFDAYDKDRDGKIGTNDIEQLLKDADIGNAFTRGMWVKGIMDELDTKKDKVIDWEEFSAVVATK